MPKSKEYVLSSDDDSSENEEVKSKRKQKREIDDTGEKTSKKSKRESSENQDYTWDLGNNRQVTVRDFKGKIYVDIREMYFDKDGNLKPGKKGICLSVAQWRKLSAVIEDVDKAVHSKS
ncbi:single stranded-binding protein c31A [Megachile rotundata]|uniref:single stranded-binding protein c31A n=1 Tax=Megachile rotundata TaxID=143995 RepID=UPI000258F456|nr:PREDICTED: activated RNA polymerase II transcriptional coactivator p15 isoform X2 [Megachile rotundata]